MKKIIILFCLFLVIGCSRKDSAEKGMLEVELPTGWNFMPDQMINFYAMKTDLGDNLLMFHKWPPPSKPDEIHKLLGNIANNFIQEAKSSTEFSLVDDKYVIEQFEGNQCKGKYVKFILKTEDENTIQTIFMMSIEGQIWDGQYTGSKEHWKEALNILTKIKKK